MKHSIFTVLVALAVLAAFAGYDVVSIRNGETYTVVAPAKVARVQVLSSVADGTADVKCASRFAVQSDADVITYTTNLTYTVVATNYVDGARVTTTNTVAFNPYPYGHANWTSFTTNNVVTAVTNKVPTTSSTVRSTNTVASVTCTNGAGGNTPSDAWVLPGDELFFEGTAKGIISIILAR